MKKKLVIFFSLFILICSFVSGCSKNNIKKIEIIEDSIKRNYIVGEEVDVNNFELKVTYSNEKEEYYYISNEKVGINKIDNSKVGEQKLNITFNYNNTDVNLQLAINFDLPNDVKNVIKEIDELPELENLNFDYEIIIKEIKEEYNMLSNFNKSYVSNYDKLLTSEEYLFNLRKDNITSDFIEYRSNVKLSLSKYYATLNKANYYDDEWEEIGKIYNYGISSLMNDNNFNKIDSIYTSTISNIKKVNTAYLVMINNAKKDFANKLKKYRNTIDNSLYSEDNVYKLNLILENGLNNINSSITENDINKNYNDSINALNDVSTKENEKEIYLKSIIDKNIYNLNIYYISIDFSKYSDENKNNIRNNYLTVIDKINSLNNDSSMNECVEKYKEYVNSIYTIKEENVIMVNNYKNDSITYINDLYKSVDINQYSLENRKLIENQYNISLNNIKNSTSIDKISEEKIDFCNYIDSVPTMLDEAISNLPTKIKTYKIKLNDIVSNYDLSDCSINVIEMIDSIVAKAEDRLDSEVNVYTSDGSIENIISEAINEINSLLAKQ